jgi:pyruvate dehydrogenase E1 component beta subunit
MGEEVAEYQGAYKVSQGLLEEFGAKRVIDTPITEHGFAGLAIGASMAGLKPIVEFMTFNFAMQAMDQIINSAAKTNYMSGGQVRCPIVFRGPNGAASGVGAQHSQCFASWYAHIPGLKVIAPYDATDSKALLKQAILDPNPIIFLENEMTYGYEFDLDESEVKNIKIGEGKVVREGSDITIPTYSIMVEKALEAAKILEKDGISVEVIDLRTIRPLDEEIIINSVKKTNRILSIEEGWSNCGVTAEITSRIVEKAFDYLDSEPRRLGAKDVPLPYSKNLELYALPSIEEIVVTVKQMF